MAQRQWLDCHGTGHSLRLVLLFGALLNELTQLVVVELECLVKLMSQVFILALEHFSFVLDLRVVLSGAVGC